MQSDFDMLTRDGERMEVFFYKYTVSDISVNVLGISKSLIGKFTQQLSLNVCGHFYRPVNDLCYTFKGTLLNSE